ncbi:hypothetical protein M422DRAFT_162438, partial [Sphaerobolus stellatus SS14]
MILGLPWLRQHNPEVDRRSGEVKMTRCDRCCSGCKAEIKHQAQIRRLHIRAVRACKQSQLPQFAED